MRSYKLKQVYFLNWCKKLGIIRISPSRKMRWAGHVARMGSRGMHIGYWCENQKEDEDEGG
jgi:hypothetical protein